MTILGGQFFPLEFLILIALQKNSKRKIKNRRNTKKQIFMEVNRL